MEEKVNVDVSSLIVIFNKNKSYILPVVVIIISVLLFLQFAIPQFNALFKAREEAKTTLAKIKKLKENLAVLSNIDDNVLDSQLNTLSLALPLRKDYIGVLDTINSVAKETNVSVGGFSLEIGDISKSENSESFFPMIRFSAPINTDILGTFRFINGIGKTAVPLSNVYYVNAGKESASVGLAFYYMPISSISNLNPDATIVPVSKDGLALIDQLIGLQKISSPEASLVPIATTSATQ